MSTIVEYIHRSFSNYQEHGITRKGGGGPYPGSVLEDAAQSIVSKQIAKVGGETSFSAFIDQFEGYANAFMGVNETPAKPNSKLQEVISYCDKEWEEAQQNAEKILRSEVEHKATLTGAVQETISLKAKDVKDTQKALVSLLKSYIKKGGINSSQAEQIKEKISELNGALQHFNTTVEKITGVATENIDVNNARIVKQQLQEALSLPSLPVRKGQLGEAITKAIIDAASEAEEEGIKQIFANMPNIEVTNVGAKTKESNIKTELIFGGQNVLDDLHISISKQVQNKVDILVSYGDEVSKQNHIGVSVKNYDLSGSSNIGVLQGSLFRLLQNDEELLKHFINIYASHMDGSKMGGAISMTRESAKDSIKKAVAAYSIMGSNLSNINDKAQIFFVIDSATGHIYVRSTARLVSFLSRNPNDIYVDINGKRLGTQTLFNQGVFKHKRREEYNALSIQDQIGIRLGNVQRSLLSSTISAHISQAAILNKT